MGESEGLVMWFKRRVWAMVALSIFVVFMINLTTTLVMVYAWVIPMYYDASSLNGFPYKACHYDSQFYKIEEINGFTFKFDKESYDMLDATIIAERDGLTYTGRSRLQNITSDIRRRYSLYTQENAAFEKIFQHVPFVAMTVEGGEQIAYAGSCAGKKTNEPVNTATGGCVYTQKFKTQIEATTYNEFIHEYAHAYQRALPNTNEQKAIEPAYQEALGRGDELAALYPTQSTFTKGQGYWYGFKNYEEYFAMGAAGWFTRYDTNRDNGWAWPMNYTVFQSEDPGGFDVSTNMWDMSPADMQTGIDECTLWNDHYTYLDTLTFVWCAGLFFPFILFWLPGITLAYCTKTCMFNPDLAPGEGMFNPDQTPGKGAEFSTVPSSDEEAAVASAQAPEERTL